MIENLLLIFMSRNRRKNQSEFRNEKMKKDDKIYVKWKGYDTFFNSWINANDIVEKAVNIFRCRSSHNVKVKLDLCNYATKPDVRKATGTDSLFQKKLIYLV